MRTYKPVGRESASIAYVGRVEQAIKDRVADRVAGLTYRGSDVARADVADILHATFTSPSRCFLANDAHIAERCSWTGVWRDAPTLEMIGGAGRKNSGSHGAGYGRDWGAKRMSGESARRREAIAAVVLMDFAGLRRWLMEMRTGAAQYSAAR